MLDKNVCRRTLCSGLNVTKHKRPTVKQISNKRELFSYVLLRTISDLEYADLIG